MIRKLRIAFVFVPALLLLLAPAGPSAAAAAEAATPPAAKTSVAAGPINVNTAGLQELTQLPGVGPALAGRIVEHRKQSGPFRRPEDLLAVKGIGPKLLAKIKDRLTFDAPAGPR